MDMPARQRPSSGLDGIAAAETALSHVDGQAGRLIVCGLDLEDFVAANNFESAAATLWAVAADRPKPSSAAVRAALGAARLDAFARLESLWAACDSLTVSEGVRLGLASLAETGADPAVAVAGALPVFTANLARRKQNQAPVPPVAARAHVEDYLHMLYGEPPTSRAVQALSTYLLTVMDHGMNASTFTARVIASTHAGLTSATVGAYAALTGPLHGGAPEPVLDMLDAIALPENAMPWVDSALQRGERIMGFGHRVYRVRDPRADVLKTALETLAAANRKLELARSVEAAALDALRRHKPGRKIETNVEFYTAMLLDGLGIRRSAFTSTFAIGRVVGWTAHAMEQVRTGRLIRPGSMYIGETARR